MKLTAALLSLAREAVAGPTRYISAVLEHPNATFHPSVWIGNGCEFGRDVSIYSGTSISQTTIGDYSYIGGGSALSNCTIGKFCSVGPDVKVGLGSHPTDRVSTYPGFYSCVASGATKFFADRDVVESLSVTIGNDVWIGMGAFVADGVAVGDGAIIAAGAVVVTDVAPYSIVGGVPAKVIRSRFSNDMIEFLLDIRWWDMDEDSLREHAGLFGNPEDFRVAMKNRK